jgi:hypothetical protein
MRNNHINPVGLYLCCLVVLAARPGVATAAQASTNVAAQASLRVISHTQAGLGDTLVVRVENWEGERAVAKDWILFFNGIPIKGIHPENQDFHDGTLRFALERNPGDAESKRAWGSLLRGFAFYRDVSVAIGPAGGPDSAIAPQPSFQLIVVPKRAFAWYCAFMTCLLLMIVLLARRSDILRDRDMSPGTGRRPYSLARTQMAWWFFLILASYLYIGMVNWDYLDSVPASALALMGIAAATALGAVLIDNDKAGQAATLANEAAALDARIRALTVELVGAAPANQAPLQTELAAKQSRLAEIRRSQASLPNRAASSSQFIDDLLSDADGVSLHRFQIFVWTLVLGSVFVVSVLRELVMPEFSPTLLALMGISAGTYLGFKFPEKKT